MISRISPRDYASLSAYLDGQLNRKDLQRLEARLAEAPDLQAELKELRRMRVVLRSLPRARAPRNFTLSPEMAGQPQRKSTRLYPVMGFASALASILFVLVVLGDFLGYIPSTPRGSESAVVEDAGPLAFVLTEEVSQEADLQMKSAAPLEEENALPETEAILTDEALSLKAPEEEEGALTLQMPLPESVTPTESIEQAYAEATGSLPEQGVGGSIYTDTLDMPLQVFFPTLTSEQPETSLRMGVTPTATPTCTPTPMPTETPLPTKIPVLIPTATATPTPMPTETPLPSLKIAEEERPTPTPTMEVLAMVGEGDASEANADLQLEAARESTEILPEEQVSRPAFSIRPVLVLQIGLLALAIIAGAAFLVLRFKES